MKRGFIQRFDLLIVIGLVGLLLSAGYYRWVTGNSRAVVLEELEQDLRTDFTGMVAEQDQRSADLLAAYQQAKLLPDDDQLVYMVFSRDCELQDWSNAEHIPSRRIVDDLCDYPNRRVLHDNNKVFYYLRHQTEEHLMVTLIPILIRYKVDNSYLPPYVFLGRYDANGYVRRASRNFDVHLRQVETDVKVFDEAGNFVFCLSVPDHTVFQQRQLLVGLVLGAASLLLLLLGAYLRLRRIRWRWKGREFPGVLAFLLLLVLVRAALFWLGLPNSYQSTELFSSTVLAIGEWSPSLGDLLLNVGLILVSVWLVIREYRRRISLFYKYALQHDVLAWTIQCLVLSICGLFTWWFFSLMADIIEHSTINFEFSNIFSLSVYSYLAFLVLGMVLVALQLILLELLRFSFHFVQGQGGAVKVLLSLSFLGALSFFLFGWEPAHLISVPLVFSLSLLVFIRSRRTMFFRMDLLNFLLLTTIFSVLATTGLVKGNEFRRGLEMERLADRQSDEHDLITESMFERVVQEVEAESFLLDYSEAKGIASRLNERFFQSNFKGFEVRIFVYDQDWTLLDKTGNSQPYIFPDSDPSLRQMGMPTMTRDLYMVPYYNGIFESIYIGQFDLLLRSLGEIRVWVELEPTEIQSTQLYPQLLLDDHVRSKSFISEGYEFAVYKDSRLFRKRSENSFPLVYTGPGEPDSLQYVHIQKDGYDSVIYRASKDKVVYVRSATNTFFDAVNVFSFIFYFFVLAAIVLMLPVWLYRLIREPSSIWHLGLKAKIQVFFMSLSILPLFIVVFVLTPYIRDHLFQDLQHDLLAQTQKVADELREDYLKLRRSNVTYSVEAALMRKRLDEIEQTIFNDINIYHSNGRLHMTTQPSIYELGLTSEYIHPWVFKQISSGAASDLVIEDEIGEITYFSGFVPILTNDRRIAGYLNIPFFKNQEQVNAQALSLLTLLVNIYVFIFLAIGLIAVLISNSIIRPLGLLSQKLTDTNLGRTNEPIVWDSPDEIGDIIRAYNQMLEKLAESEEKLARGQREQAWQEMARQVAHEIKNPLTPMRLSMQHLVRAWSVDKPSSERLNRMFEKVTNTILVQIDSLVNIANSFSQFAKMPEPQNSRFELQEVIQEVAELYSHHQEVQLEMHAPEEEFYVYSDRDQLSRVLNNVIKNGIQAIEHEDGQIEVRMEIEGDLARIMVKDNGKGIPPEIGERIFEPRFSTKSSGMGLGLAIVRKIVENAGGRIYFESKVGKGTTFYVEMPRAPETV